MASLASLASVIVVTPFLSNRSFLRTNRPTSWRCLSVSVAVRDLTATANSGDSVSVSLTRPELKPPPKPPLKPQPLAAKPQPPTRPTVIDSLGDTLNKAEKLETNPSSSPPPRPSPASAAATGNPSAKKSKTLKSVWRKGDAVSSVQKVVVKESPPKTAGPGPVRPPRPPTSRASPELQAKPSAAVAAPAKVVLKDVGAAPKRGPILIDKFASKMKPSSAAPAKVDPTVAVAAPTRPGKAPPATGRFSRKKSGPVGGGAARRRMVNDENEDERSGRVRKGRKWNKASRRAAKQQAARDAAPVRAEILEVPEKGMSIEELAFHLTVGEGEIIGDLYERGIKPDGIQTLDRDIVKILCKKYDVEVIDADSVSVEEMAKKTNEFLDEDDLDKLQNRPPVLTIMGHVDHGKTTLLDCIRKSKVASSEAGGITQGIGAYKVSVPIDGKLQTCVFLDTPGHEAFGAMRARGAKVTDIAIIVVAADDGIRPQTKEAIAHAKAAGVPIVIAINKIDRDGANPERVMQELSSIGLMAEEWGGEIPMVQVSALKGENVNELLETVTLVAEMQELKANPDRNAKGTVIEAGLDKAKGPIATLIVQNGTLKRGDIVVCGEAFGKVRALFDDDGKRVNEAAPSTPVQVIGLNNVPISGDEFEVVGSLDVAREKAESRAESLRAERITDKAGDGKVTLSSLASAVQSGKFSGLDLHQLNIIMKVDVQGSIEAVRQALQSLPQVNITLKFLLEATGDVSSSDIDLAFVSKAIILGFNVKAPGPVNSYADNKGVEIRLYKVIYELIDDVRNAMEGLLDPTEEQVTIGEVEVRAVFSSGSGRVAGCMVTEGKVVTGCGIRVYRKGKVVHVGVVESLRRVKESVKEVNNGLECGIGAEGFDDWEEGDHIVAFNSVQRRRTLEEASASITAALEGVGV